MFRRLPRQLIELRLAQLLIMFAMIFGPIANLGALQSIASDCLTGCPCDAPADTDPCGGCADDHADDEAPAGDQCADDCEDCDCDRGITSAVTPASADTSLTHMPRARPDAANPAPPQAGGPNIFIPPRR